jgi:microcystin-dependent protein
MSSPFIGEIRIFGFNFAPRGWATCDGQILSIAQNTALFSLLGTTYGGNGTSTFALPDLRGRVPIHQGQGPGLSPYVIGQAAGTETVTLITTQIPAHVHAVAPLANNTTVTTARPSGAYPGKPAANAYADSTDNSTMAPTNTNSVGGNQPHSNIQPYLTLNFCIALQGIFPSRN